MKNFKEIAEKCLVGELSGTFILHNGNKRHVSKENQTIRKDHLDPYSPYIIWNRKYSRCGVILPISDNENPYDIIDFIPDTIPEQIKIDIPEGKVPIMEQTENGIVITWKEKELTYAGIINEIANSPKHIVGFSYNAVNDTTSSSPFYRKVEVLRKLMNIRNYFGKPNSYDSGYCISRNSSTNKFYVANVITVGIWTKDVLFAKKEHAEQAIKMLGDELKYLFEPW